MMIKSLRGPKGVAAALIGACTLFGVAIAVEVVRGRKPVEDAPASPAKLADVGLLPGFALPPADQGFPEVANRPLFVPTRRPAPPAAATQASMPKGQFTLLGTSVTKELGDIAMLKHLPTNKFHSVRKGEQVNGITVDTVQPDRVILRMGEETEEISMRTAKSPALPPSPPPGTMPSAGPIPSGSPGPAMPGSMPSRQPQPAPGFGPGPGPGPVPGVTPAPVMPSAAAPGQPPAAAAQQLTPEQIIARRRAARAQQTQ
jgi:general secretion pathway protein N